MNDVPDSYIHLGKVKPGVASQYLAGQITAEQLRSLVRPGVDPRLYSRSRFALRQARA